MEFLVELASHEEKNRMGPKNLSLVFGASLLDPPNDSQIDARMHAFNIKLQSLVVENMISNFAVIFPDKTPHKPRLVANDSLVLNSQNMGGVQLGGQRRRMMMLGLDSDNDSSLENVIPRDTDSSDACTSSSTTTTTTTTTTTNKTHFAELAKPSNFIKRETSAPTSPRPKARLVDVHIINADRPLRQSSTEQMTNLSSSAK
jgi:hypothetical protein